MNEIQFPIVLVDTTASKNESTLPTLTETETSQTPSEKPQTPLDQQKAKAAMVLKYYKDLDGQPGSEKELLNVLRDIQGGFDLIQFSTTQADRDLYENVTDIQREFIGRVRPKTIDKNALPALEKELGALFGELNVPNKQISLRDLALKFSNLKIPDSETSLLQQRSALLKIAANLGTLSEEELKQLKTQLNPALFEIVERQVGQERPEALRNEKVAQDRLEAARVREAQQQALVTGVETFYKTISGSKTLETVLAAAETYRSLDPDGKHNRYIGDVANFLRIHRQQLLHHPL